MTLLDLFLLPFFCGVSAGTRIAAALALDGTEFDAGLQKAEAKAVSWRGRMQRHMAGAFGGDKSAKDSATAYSEIFAAEQRLAEFRKRTAFDRLSDTQKIEALNTDITATTQRIAQINGTTAEKLELQLQVERQLLQVEQLRAQVAARRNELAGPSSARSAGTGSVEGQLTRTFGLANALKGLLAGVGFASVGTIADRLTSIFREQAERAKEVADHSERATRAQQALIDLKRSDPERLDALRGQQASLYRQLAEINADEKDGFITAADATNRRAPLTADLAENALAQAEVLKRIEEDRQRRAEELAAAKRELAEAEQRHLEAQLSGDERLDLLQERILSAQQEADSPRASELDRIKARTEVQNLLLEKSQLEKDLAEKKTRELEKQEALTRKIAEASARAAKAEAAALAARAALAAAPLQALQFSLSEAAIGQRGGGDLTLAAGRIAQDEDRARTLFDRSANAYYRSQNATTEGERARQLEDARRFEREALDFSARARDARGSLPGLNEQDRDPLKKFKDDLKSALDEAKTLQDIRDSLKAEKIQ